MVWAIPRKAARQQRRRHREFAWSFDATFVLKLTVLGNGSNALTSSESMPYTLGNSKKFNETCCYAAMLGLEGR